MEYITQIKSDSPRIRCAKSGESSNCYNEVDVATNHDDKK